MTPELQPERYVPLTHIMLGLGLGPHTSATLKFRGPIKIKHGTYQMSLVLIKRAAHGIAIHGKRFDIVKC